MIGGGIIAGKYPEKTLVVLSALNGAFFISLGLISFFVATQPVLGLILFFVFSGVFTGAGIFVQRKLGFDKAEKELHDIPQFNGYHRA